MRNSKRQRSRGTNIVRMTSIFDPWHQGVAMLDVLAGNHLSASSLMLCQQQRLRSLLETAAQGSPVYASRLRRVRAGADMLRQMAPVTKAELMGQFDDWVIDPMLKLPQLRDFVANPKRIAEPYLGKYLVWESSGTTHEPGIFVQDAKSLAVYDALEVLRRSAPRPLVNPLHERVAFVGATGGHFASMVSMKRLQALNPVMAQTARCFSILQNPARLLNELNAFAPTVLATYPTVAAWLADEVQRGGLRFTPAEVWTGGETLSHGVRRRLEQGLKCEVRNSYGASEFMSIAWECPHGQLHVNADWAILEPVDERGQPVPVGEASYSTLLTHLANHVQPLIRYDLGDQILWHADACTCGSFLPVIDVWGRCDDVLLLEGRTGRTVTVLPLALTTVLEDDAGVFDFQLCQSDARSVILTLNVSVAEAPAVEVRCRQVLAAFAKRQGVVPLQIEIRWNPVIPRGRSGKAKRVVALAPADS